MPLLSIIIPTYNSERTIERCLESLVCQTFQDFEICVIDAASSDRTIAQVNRFRSRLRNIRIFSELDQGIYDAMNKGIDIAQGDWLYFLGSDDEVFDSQVFSDIFKTPIPEKSSIVYGNVHIEGDTLWSQGDRIYDGAFDAEKIISKNICHQSIFYRKTLFQKFGKYKLEYPVCADWELNLRFFLRSEPIYLDRTIAKFYGGGHSSKASNDPICSLEKMRRQSLKGHYFHQLVSSFQSIYSR